MFAGGALCVPNGANVCGVDSAIRELSRLAEAIDDGGGARQRVSEAPGGRPAGGRIHSESGAQRGGFSVQDSAEERYWEFFGFSAGATGAAVAGGGEPGGDQGGDGTADRAGTLYGGAAVRDGNADQRIVAAARPGRGF